MILHRVRLQVAAGLLLTGLGVTLALFGSSGGAAVTNRAFGISDIPGMTKVIDDPRQLCTGIKGSGWLPYCSLTTTSSIEQGWVQDAAIQEYGTLDNGLPLPIPLKFAQEHPGPAEVFLMVMTFATQDEAQKLLNDPQWTGTWDTADYTPLPSAAIDGGLAGEQYSGANDGLTEYRFNWVSGTSEVDVNVIGAKMTVQQARAVAMLTAPQDTYHG